MGNIKKPSSLRNELIFGAIAIGMGIQPNFSIADEFNEEKNKETVIITGTRTSENPYADAKAPYRVKKSANELLPEELINTPKSITALSEELLEDMGMNTFRDLFRTQPGITLGTGEGGNAFGDRIFIRGFDARNDVYIDGARDPGLGSREVFATQQIEIIKGPSSTFGGRGTTGGAVSLISKKPRNINSTSVELTIGTEDTTRLTIDTNKIINDDLAIRLNLMGHKGGIAGRDNVHNDRYGFAFAALYQPIAPLKIEFDYYHLTTDYMPDWGLPWNSITNSVGEVKRSNFYGLKNRDYGETQSDVYTIGLSYEFDDNLSLSSILRYGKTNNEYRATAPEGANFTANIINNRGVLQPAYSVAANAKNRFQLTDYITSQTNLSKKFNIGKTNHTLISGIELSQENTRMLSYNFTECGAPPCTGVVTRVFQDLFNPDFNYPWAVSGETPIGHTDINTQTKAAYLVDNIRFSDKWIALLGIRFDNYQTERTSLTYATNLAGVPIISNTDFISYQAGLVYKPSESSSIYVNYGTSANPPCEQLDATGVDYGGCTTTTYSTDPIENQSFEFGGKFNLNQHLDLTAAFFKIDRNNVPAIIGTNLYFESQKVDGIELSASGNINQKLALVFGFTMFNSNTDESTNPNSGNLGKPFANVSEISTTLTTKYQLNQKVAFGGTWVSQSEKYGGTYSAGAQKLDGFNRFDFMAEYKIKSGLSLQFNLLNATNETYFDALYRSSTPYVYIAPARSASILIDWHF